MILWFLEVHKEAPLFCIKWKPRICLFLFLFKLSQHDRKLELKTKSNTDNIPLLNMINLRKFCVWQAETPSKYSHQIFSPVFSAIFFHHHLHSIHSFIQLINQPSQAHIPSRWLLLWVLRCTISAYNVTCIWFLKNAQYTAKFCARHLSTQI